MQIQTDPPSIDRQAQEVDGLVEQVVRLRGGQRGA